MTSITIANTEIPVDQEGRVSLNALHKASGLGVHKTPGQWVRRDEVKLLIKELSVDLHLGQNVINLVKGGKNPGTYAHVDLAISYAGWISPAFQIKVNRTFYRVQTGDTTIVDEVLDRATPEDTKRTLIRNNTKHLRREFTDTLQKHGVTGPGYAKCTNEMYKGLFGGDSKSLRRQKGLPAKTNLRNHFSLKELFAVGLTEEVSKENIEEKDLHGNVECASECRLVANEVSKAANL